MSGDRKTDDYQQLQAEIRGYLIGATVLAVSVCDRLASDIAGMAMKRRERTEFGQILAGLRDRGLITQADVDRLERDGEGTPNAERPTSNAEGKEVGNV